MKAEMPEISGNTSLRRRLCDDIINSRLSHAYIIEGPKGSGRHLFARNIAKAAACMNRNADGLPLPCGICENCRKISADISPDVITVSRDGDKSGIGVETARFIRSDVRTVPNDLDIKVYIIEDADRMTVQAQNALLLTLEEPPLFAVFLLLCEQADNLLETVRSRAPTLRTQPVPPDIMRKFLCEGAPESITSAARQLKLSSPSGFDEIITASGGCIGKAEELLDPDKRAPALESRAEVRRFVSAMLDGGSYDAMLDALSAFPQKREELSDRLDTAVVALRDLMVLKKCENAELCFYSDADEASELSSKRSAAALSRFVTACNEASEALRRNANITLTVTALASAAVKR